MSQNSFAVASLDPLFTYGVKPNVHGGIHFTKDHQTLLYPSGCGIALHSHKIRKQDLVPLADKGKHLTAIGVNKNRKLVAFAERGDRPHVVVYDLEERKRKRVLRCAEFVSQEVISLAFSHDSKCLLAQGGPPDYSLVYFFWEKNKIITTLKSLSTIKNPVTEVSFHPKDRSVVCIVGQGIFKMCRLTEGVLKQFGFQKAEHHSMLCHDWLSSRHVTIGTKAGKVLILEDAELKATIDLVSLIESSDLSMTTTGSVSTATTALTSDSKSLHGVSTAEHREIHALITYKGGFICSLGSGRVVVVQCKMVKDAEEIQPTVSQIIRLPSRNTTTAGSFMSSETASGNKVISLALNGNETTLIGLTDTLQLMCFNLAEVTAASASAATTTSTTTTTPAKTKNEFTVFSYPFHHGAITGVDVCQRKPLVVTCGADRSIKVWNYLSLELELSKEFEESIESVALHPTGMYVLAGFADKLRLMNLLIDDLKTFRELPVRNCSACAFSGGGHLFAAVSHNLISLFSSVDFRNTVNLKGHDGKVSSLCWSNDDQRLVSCAEDGSLYEWDVPTGKRVHESVMKTCSYFDVTLSPHQSELKREAASTEGNLVYAVGTDKTIKQIKGSNVLREIDLHTLTLSSVVLAHNGNMLFTGSTTGRVQSFKFPLTLPGEWTEYKIHGDTITQMKLSLDDHRLITASRDGSLCFWEVRDAEGDKPAQLDDSFEYANEILITKTELEEKNRLVFNLQQQVDETKTESEYQLRLKDNKYTEDARMAKKKFQAEVNELKQTINKLQNDIVILKQDQQTALNQLHESNDRAMIEMSEQYKAKLIVEYQKYSSLEEMYTSIKKSYDKKMGAVEKATKEELIRMKTEFDAKLEVNKEEVRRHAKESEDKVRAVEEILKQTEEDADKEILELKTKYEKLLRTEREANVRMRGESGIVKKKLQTLIKDSDEHRSSIGKMTTENQKLHTTIRNLEKDISDLKSEIKNRDDTIADKEKRITDLKRNAIELEKHRFVLEHKIEELRQQILPKEGVIMDLRSQIDAMEDELNNVTRGQGDLESQLEESKSKLTAASSELIVERKKAAKQLVFQTRMQKDLASLGNLMQDPKSLRESVAIMIKKFAKSAETAAAASIEEDTENKKALEEILRQKAFLERSVSSLKSQMEKERHIHKQEYLRKMKENAFLLQEIEELKKELKKATEYKIPAKLSRHSSSSVER